MRPFRILLVGHGKLPAALLASAELITGAIEDLAAVSLHAHETPDHFASAVRDAVGGDRRRVLILTDLQGGTPHNVAAALALQHPRIVCVSGVNLPMLLEAALGLGQLDDEAIAHLLEVGRKSISALEAARSAPIRSDPDRPSSVRPWIAARPPRPPYPRPTGSRASLERRAS